MLRRVYAVQRTLQTRWKSHAVPPDNAPTLLENEQWLQQLMLAQDTAGPARYPFQEQSRSKINTNTGFPYEVIQDPTGENTYLQVEASIGNFTSTKYLGQFNNHHHHRSRDGNFTDTRIIHCKSGDGGNGTISFARDANRRIGPPDGGDGGKGGSVYVQAIAGLNSLSKLRTKYFASNGLDGASGQLDGSTGKDLLIQVPLGTTIRWCMDPQAVKSIVATYKDKENIPLREILNRHKTVLDCVSDSVNSIPRNIQLYRYGKDALNENNWLFKDKSREYHYSKQWFLEFNKYMDKYDENMLNEELSRDQIPLFGYDLDTASTTPLKLLTGGEGGMGNMHFLTSMIRNPRFAKPGRKGLESWFLFELKIIADLGLIGFPNAGKSTILNKISNARPRIGHWEFTTLTPSLGTVPLAHTTGESFTVADIPGIIKDAHLDKGMGLEFIKHIERSKCWCFVVSLENRNPLQDLHTLIDEVGGLDKVQQKRVLVVANKADTQDRTQSHKFTQLQEFCLTQHWDTVPVSALHNHNMDLLVQKMSRCLQ